MERFFDAEHEPFQQRSLLPDLNNDQILSLEQACDLFKRPIKKIDSMIKSAKKNSSNVKHNLSIDEAAAIYLFTMEQTEAKHTVYSQLNQALRSEDNIHLEPWYHYFRLLSMALEKLPPTKCVVYRGVRTDVWEQYEQEHVYWRGFSSCSKTQKSIEKLLGKKGTRILFEIHCNNGKSIGQLSCLDKNDEVILMPNIYLRVLRRINQQNGVHVIRLQEESDSYNSDSTPTKQPSMTNQPHTEKQCSGVHSAGAFRAEHPWLDRQFHSSKGSRSIVKPDELQARMDNPPADIDGEIYNRIRGSIVAMSLGDALGAHVEFRPREFLVQNPVKHLKGGGTWGLEKGQFTDDTSMALCLACSLIVRHGFVPYDQLVRYKWWYKDGYMSSTGVCFDIGAATRQSITEFERRQKKFAVEYGISPDELDFLSDHELLEKFDVYCSEYGVAGNGALMRLAPVPLFFYNYPEYAVEFSGRSGMITHGDRKAYDACRYYGALIVAALQRESKDELLSANFYREHITWFNNVRLCEEIEEIMQGSYKRKSGYEEGIRGKGYIVNALEAALWAFYNDKGSFKKGALAAVNLGDDTDTTAAIYGQLAGAYYGFHELPEKWTSEVYANKFLKCVSKWITYEGNNWRPERPFVTSLRSPFSQANDFVTTRRSENADADVMSHPTPDTEVLREPPKAPHKPKRSRRTSEEKSNRDLAQEKILVSNDASESVTPRRSHGKSRPETGRSKSVRCSQSRSLSQMNNDRPVSASKPNKSGAK
ncbi:unnamed protein product [Adineta ricciae]|uniref:NAD(P)(+)--arginine ADP-ribosyltransferase n=1 Tax=Adineta ricciae TaxID=249248 RepID=A0A815G6T7_ADIRI|nr:unnamed protein product [Adineta ricciae]